MQDDEVGDGTTSVVVLACELLKVSFPVNELSLLLLYCHRHLRMVSEALELYVNGGRVSHSWCMCVVGHVYGCLGVGWDGGGGWYACETKPVGLVVRRVMLEHFLSAK